jgi:hypothetical protein
MDVHRDAAAIVTDGDGAIDMDIDQNVIAVAGQMLVHGVIEHLRDAVMQSPLVRAANIHARLLADRFKTFEFAQFRCVVSFAHSA